MTASGVALCQPLRGDQPKLPGLPRSRRLNDEVGILVGREPAPDPGFEREVAQLDAGGAG